MTISAGGTQVEAPRPEEVRQRDGASVQRPLKDRLAVSRSVALLAVAAGVVFCFFVFQPLWHTDLWGHLAYGRHVSMTGRLPETEPLMPLSEGVPFVDTAWLSQWIGFNLYRAGGAAAIQFLHALGVTVCVALLLGRVYGRTGSSAFSLVAGALFLWVGWQHLTIVRPQLSGLVCFLVLLALLTGRRSWKGAWVAVPVLFVLWANLHGSWPVGLAVLAGYCLGRGCDVLRRTDKFSAVIADPAFRRSLLLTELAAAAVLLNPYGIGLYAEVWRISQNANLSDIVEWEPLTLHMKQGRAAALVALALVMIYRVSPRRVSVSEIVLLAGLGGAALWTSRMIVWWAPVAAYYAALHGNAAARRVRKRVRKREADPSPSLLWTATCVLVVVVCAAAKPLEPLLRGRQAVSLRSRVSMQTPVAAVRHLRENPPQGQVFNSYQWGDYLLWAGPPDVRVFVASHAQLVPPDVWQAYMRVVNLTSGWEEVLGFFGVNAVLVEKQRRSALVERLRRDNQWRVSFEDDLAIVFRRVNPI